MKIEPKVSQAVSYYPCNLLFVHRDADGEGHVSRKAEVLRGIRVAGVAIPAVSLVPVRMTESWLLCDGAAIRRASGSPNGTAPIPLPAMREIEGIPNPKQTLAECLCLASGKAGRKLEVFKKDLPSLKYRVAELVDDFSGLRNVSSFNEFVVDLQIILDANALR